MNRTLTRLTLATTLAFAAPMVLAQSGQDHHGHHGHGSAAQAARSAQGSHAGHGDHHAHGDPAGHAGHQGHDVQAMHVEEAVVDLPMQAREAAATVDRFMTALTRGDFDAARAELAPEAVVFESGRAERSAEEYFGGHAGHDAAFLKSTHHQPRHRLARVSGDLAWVANESEFHADRDGHMPTVFSTETMVLPRSGPRWQIVHIHWSSHEKLD